MPTRIGSPQLAFARKTGSFITGGKVDHVLDLKVQDAYYHRKIYVAVLAVEGEFTGVLWDAKVQGLLNDREQDVPMRFGWRQDLVTPTGVIPDLDASIPVITPPFWVETITSGTYWPVVDTAADELTAFYQDANNARAYRVHMKPIRTTGHFDKLRLTLNIGSASLVSGEQTYLILIGCESRPIA